MSIHKGSSKVYNYFLFTKNIDALMESLEVIRNIVIKHLIVKVDNLFELENVYILEIADVFRSLKQQNKSTYTFGLANSECIVVLYDSKIIMMLSGIYNDILDEVGQLDFLENFDNVIDTNFYEKMFSKYTMPDSIGLKFEFITDEIIFKIIDSLQKEIKNERR